MGVRTVTPVGTAGQGSKGTWCFQYQAVESVPGPDQAPKMLSFATLGLRAPRAWVEGEGGQTRQAVDNGNERQPQVEGRAGPSESGQTSGLGRPGPQQVLTATSSGVWREASPTVTAEGPC